MQVFPLTIQWHIMINKLHNQKGFFGQNILKAEWFRIISCKWCFNHELKTKEVQSHKQQTFDTETLQRKVFLLWNIKVAKYSSLIHLYMHLAWYFCWQTLNLSSSCLVSWYTEKDTADKYRENANSPLACKKELGLIL